MEFLKDLFTVPVIWFILGLLMLLLEFMIPGLIIIFFGVGAWIVALLCYLFDIGINLQLLIFIASSVILLISLRRKMQNIFAGQISGKQQPGARLENFIGQQVLVTKAIKPGATGKVEFHGALWNAEADEEISAGTRAKIIGKESITLKVEKIKS